MLDCLCEYAPIGGEESEVDRNQMTHWQMKLYTTFSKFWEILLKYKKNKLFSISDIVFFSRYISNNKAIYYEIIHPWKKRFKFYNYRKFVYNILLPMINY